MKILVANLGSTSFKYRLFDMEDEHPLAHGAVERIGSPQSRPTVSYPQAGAFVKFLVERHGKDKLLHAYKALKNSSDQAVRQRNRQTLEKICGQSLDRLERDWVKTVMSTP